MSDLSFSELDCAYIDRKVFNFLVSIDGFSEAQTKEKLNEVYRNMAQMEANNRQSLAVRWGLKSV